MKCCKDQRDVEIKYGLWTMLVITSKKGLKETSQIFATKSDKNQRKRILSYNVETASATDPGGSQLLLFQTRAGPCVTTIIAGLARAGSDVSCTGPGRVLIRRFLKI